MYKNSEELAWLIRRHSVEMMLLSNGSHIAGVLSEADILAVLYSDILKYDSKKPKSDERDYLVLSKGHCCAGLYAALAESGFFPVESLKQYCQDDSFLPGHSSHHLVPGVDASSGSLGHGLSYAVGIAYALKKSGLNNKVFVILGDGECDEGSVWEAVLLSSQLKLSNLYVIVDRNRMQALDFTESIIPLDDLESKFLSFHWDAKTVDGHNHRLIKDGFLSLSDNDKPHCLICETIKGKGISFMENDILWHYRFPHTGGEYEKAVEELLNSCPPGLNDPYRKEK